MIIPPSPLFPVTPPGDDGAMGGAWNPWRSLRDEWPEVTFELHALGALGGGALSVHLPDGGVILIDPRLDQQQRRAALAHEIVHLERGVTCPPATRLTMVTEERYVCRETARRLVPLDALAELVDQLVALDEPVRAIDVMEEFNVPVDVANQALWLLDQQRRRE